MATVFMTINLKISQILKKEYPHHAVKLYRNLCHLNYLNFSALLLLLLATRETESSCIVRVRNDNDCRIICQLMMNCEAFTYIKSSRYCYPKVRKKKISFIYSTFLLFNLEEEQISNDVLLIRTAVVGMFKSDMGTNSVYISVL